MLRTALFLALIASVVACDSAPGPEPEPGPSGPPMASITVALDEITPIRDCDSGSNPGDFHFQIGFADARNQPLASAVELPSGTYGVNGSGSNTIALNDNQSLPVGQAATFSLAEEVGSAFTVAFSLIEWDSTTVMDPDADDISGFRTHEFGDGRFQNIVGQQRVSVYGRADCRVELTYSISIR